MPAPQVIVKSVFLTMDNLPRSFGRYTLIEKLAAGGMAEIFRAKLVGIEGFEKTLVIKCILPFWSQRQDFITMLVDEAKVLVHLNHPNIVQVYELGRVGETYFIAMEYMEGADLRRLQVRAKERGKSLSSELAIHIMLESLQGLQYAHERSLPGKGHLGIVHRDISPPNILLNLEGEVKVTDFGIAKAVTQTHETQTGVLKGKYAYMSPEQALGVALDGRSDLFASGVVLYELLIGERLFSGKNEFKILTKVRDVQVPWESEKVKALSGPLIMVLKKALAREVSDRYATADEFHRELDACLPAGWRGGKRHLAEFCRELFLKDFQDRRDQPTTTSPTQLAGARQTQVLDAPEEETVSLVEAQDAFEAPPTRATTIKPMVGPRVGTTPHPMPTPTPSLPMPRPKYLPYFLAVLWVFLGVGMTWGIFQFFQGEQTVQIPPSEQPATASPSLGTPAIPPPVKVTLVATPSPTPLPTPVGILSLKAQPASALIRVTYGDKKLEGTGRLEVKEIPVGVDVRISAIKKGYISQSRKIKFETPDQVIEKSFALKKEAPKVGNLKVNALPWGKITVSRLGRSDGPFSRKGVPVGSYRVVVKNDNIGKTASGTATVRSGRTTRCSVNFNGGGRLLCN